MTDNDLGLVRIRRALISVSDKTGIVDFARELKRFDVEIISTGGTAKALRAAGIEVRDVSEVTGFPELMDGRIKTLHPRIHGALLALRDSPEHVAAMSEHQIDPIDMVVVNLYPFEETISNEGVTLEEAIEQIDIGGPAMIRSAAKNWRHVAVVTTSALYDRITREMKEQDGALSSATRGKLAQLAFTKTSLYDTVIFSYLETDLPRDEDEADAPFALAFFEVADALTERMMRFGLSDYEEDEFDLDCEDKDEEQELANVFATDNGEPHEDAEIFGDYEVLELYKLSDLRYGENPHQQGALYESEGEFGVADAELLNGKEMSFNNYVDADAAWQLVCDVDELACAIVKHTNPAGVGLGTTPQEAYRKALATDPVSAFGGIVAFNRTLDEAAARAVIEIFTEVVIAPDYEPDALRILKTKRNLRVLRAGTAGRSEGLEYKQIGGGMLLQTRNTERLSPGDLKVVTRRQPTEEEIRALLFAWTVCKHTKSNAIVYAREGQTVGVGAGQMSRVDSVKVGAMRAQLPIKGSVLASDAFFPFRDGIDEAAKHGITAVIQPGGSRRDAGVIAAADEHDLAMVFTGIRHFKH